jgi:cell division protein YceG involved in septum cleavage
LSRGDRSRNEPSRSAEDRERDRLERERRRSQRDGQPGDAAEAGDPAAVGQAGDAAAAAETTRAPAPAEPPVPDEPPISGESAVPAEPPDLEPAAAAPVDRTPAAGDPAAAARADPLAGVDAPEAWPELPDEAEDGAGALSAAEAELLATAGTPAALEPYGVAPIEPDLEARASEPGGGRGEPRSTARSAPESGGAGSRLARPMAVIALLIAAAAVAVLLYALLRPGHKTPAEPAGIVKIVIPEGETRAQIAHIATHAGLAGSYLAYTRHSPLLEPSDYGAPAGTNTLEGFLFPATYEEFAGARSSRLVRDQLVAFQENFGGREVARARDLHITPYQLLIVASMIEREARVPGDRAKIAAVVYNRLAQGMPLGIDATIYYAIEQQKGVAVLTHELTEAELHINSPYNTRTHVGLPPTPISNPGLASIHAASYPAHVPYLYYVAAPDGCGEMVFSTTAAEFEPNAAAYQAAVKRNGGRPPTCKK